MNSLDSSFASLQKSTVRVRVVAIRLIAALGMAGATRAQIPEPSAERAPASKANTGGINRKLASIVIPNLDFRDASIREVVDFLKAKSIEMDKSEPDPAKRGVNIVLRLDVPRDPDGPSPARLPAAKISFANTDISLGLALRGVAEQAGLKMRILPNRVELAPPAPEPLVVRKWDFTPEFAQKFFGVVEGLSTKDFLLASGVTFPSGATALLSADRRWLVIKNTAENLDLMDVLIEATSEPAAQNQAEAEEIPTTADTRRKAAGIVIPEFDLRYATLRDAVDILKKKSIEWDTGEPKRALRGVNIVLQLDGDQPGGNPLTLSLRNVSVLEALRRVAAAGGVRLKVDTEGFVYLPGQADDVLLQTWELKLGEGAQAALSAPNGNTGIARRLDAKEFLQARGVPFPEGARATHLVTSARLIVRNTEANMDRIEAVLEALDPVSPGK